VALRIRPRLARLGEIAGDIADSRVELRNAMRMVPDGDDASDWVMSFCVIPTRSA
jgi:hypothetical protein